MLEGKLTAPAQVDVVRHEKNGTLLRVTIREGRKRQIREVASLLGHPVQSLLRVRLGPLKLGTLGTGQWRHLTAREVRELDALKRARRRRGRRPRRAR
jgi:pseudouridine synthase